MCQEVFHIGRQWRGEVHFFPGARMAETEGAGVEGLAGATYRV